MNHFDYLPNIDKYDECCEYYLEEIRTEIEVALSMYPNFNGVSFSDRTHDGSFITIDGWHKEFETISFPFLPTATPANIKSDFSNYKSAIQIFINEWKSYDNEIGISSSKSMVKYLNINSNKKEEF